MCLARTEHSVQGTWINNMIRAMLYDQHLGAQILQNYNPKTLQVEGELL